MSLRALTAVWDHSPADGGTLLVLLALADYADEAGWSYPSVATLAKKARLSERATQYCLRDLAAAGEIEVEERTGPKGCNRYRVTCLDTGATVAPRNECTGASDAGRGANDGAGGCNPRRKGVQPAAPKPSGNHQEEPPKEPSAAAAHVHASTREAAAAAAPGQLASAGDDAVDSEPAAAPFLPEVAMVAAFCEAMQTDVHALPVEAHRELVRHARRAVELGHRPADVEPAVAGWRRDLERGHRQTAVRPPRSGQVLDALVKWARTAPPTPLFDDDDDPPPLPVPATPQRPPAGPPVPPVALLWPEPHLGPVLEALGYTPASCPPGERLLADRLLRALDVDVDVALEVAHDVAQRSAATDLRRVAELQGELYGRAVIGAGR